MLRLPERTQRICLLARLLFKDLLRRRVTLLLLFIVPALFDVIILVTTADRQDPVMFGIFSAETMLLVSRRALAFVFLGVAAVCFLTSFLAFYLVHRRTEPDRRLVLCGYHPVEIIFAKSAVLAVIVLSIAAYEALIISPFFSPLHFERVLAGLFLGGLVYSCYGLLVGAVSKHELEGIFLIVLLANIDVGWLQNPIYYKESNSRQVIELLPGYFPTQLACAGAFTHELPFKAIAGALLYAGFFLSAAALIFGRRLRRRSEKAPSEKRFYAKVFLLTYAIWIVVFQIVGNLAATLHTHDPTSSWDRMIPLLPEFVWFYELCYVFPLLPLFVAKDYHRLNILLLSVILANLSAFIIYFLCPIAFAQPQLGNSLAEKVLHLEYVSDFHPGANKFPSMHVAFAWLVYLVIRGQKLSRPTEGVVFFLALMISLSTLFVKQHILLDVFGGIIWALLSWKIATALYPKLTDPLTPPPLALRVMLKNVFKI